MRAVIVKGPITFEDSLGNGTLARDAGLRAVQHARACDDGPTLAYALRWYAKGEMRFEAYDAARAALSEAETIANMSPRLRSSLLEGRTLRITAQ